MDEQQKQRVLTAVVAFNFTAMAVQLVFNMGRKFSYPKLGLAIGLGLVVGALAYVASKWLQK
jgi:hypothetical protein